VQWFSSFLVSGRQCLHLAGFPSRHSLGYVLDSLIVAPRVTAISFPASEDSHWDEFGDILRRNPNIRYIATAEKANDQFMTLSENLPDVQSHIVCLSFENCELRPRHAQVVADICQRLRIPGIRFVGDLFQKATVSFYRTMAAIDTFKSLSIDGCTDFSTSDVLSSFARRHLDWLGVTRADSN
jgi:hypothetical protein